MNARPAWFLATVFGALVGTACVDAPAPITPASAAARGQGSAAPQQSPIDIEHHDLRFVGTRDLSAIRVRYTTHATLDVENTGSPEEEATVRANVARGDGEVRVDGRVFPLAQFHWHVPAEHEVDGVRYPMELHLVHAAAEGATLVVAVLLREGAANAGLAPLFHHLPSHPGEHITATRFDVSALLPRGWHAARYTGSLTTAPYTEGVRWIVIAPPVEVSREQIAEFRALFPHGNSREVQPVNGRIVVTDDRTFEQDEGVTVVAVHTPPTARH